MLGMQTVAVYLLELEILLKKIYPGITVNYCSLFCCFFSRLNSFCQYLFFLICNAWLCNTALLKLFFLQLSLNVCNAPSYSSGKMPFMP